MGRQPTLVHICVDCGARGQLGALQAKRAGWKLWIGGGWCPKCYPKHEPQIRTPQPTGTQPDPVYVRCSACGRAPLRGAEMTPDAWWPTFHWLATEENKLALKERKRPIPLCPGIHRPGAVVKVERVPLDEEQGDRDAPVEAP